MAQMCHWKTKKFEQITRKRVDVKFTVEIFEILKNAVARAV